MALLFRIDRDPSDNLWAGGTVQVTPPTYGAEQWGFDSEIGTRTASGYDVAVSLVDWFNDAGRAWTGVYTLAAAYSAAGSINSQVAIKFTISPSAATTTWAVVGSMVNLMGMPASRTSTNITAAPIQGTVWGNSTTLTSAGLGGWGVRSWTQYQGKQGPVSQSGSALGGIHATSPVRPSVMGYLDPEEAYALAIAQRLAATPRQAHIYDLANTTWRLVDVASIKVKRRSAGTYQATLQTLG